MYKFVCEIDVERDVLESMIDVERYVLESMIDVERADLGDELGVHLMYVERGAGLLQHSRHLHRGCNRDQSTSANSTHNAIRYVPRPTAMRIHCATIRNRSLDQNVVAMRLIPEPASPASA